MPLKKHSMTVPFPYPPVMTAVNKFNGILNLIVAYTFNEQGIGYQGKLPWHIPEDMQHFKEVTSSKFGVHRDNIEQISMVIMGRKTWESIPTQYKPLSNRFNIVLSTNKEYCDQGNLQYTRELETITNENWHEGVYFSNWDDFFGQNFQRVGDRLQQTIRTHTVGADTNLGEANGLAFPQSEVSHSAHEGCQDTHNFDQNPQHRPNHGGPPTSRDGI